MVDENIYNRPIRGGHLDPVFVANGDEYPVPVTVGESGSMPFTFSDTPAIDAFGRLRVSNPQTLFDSKNIFDDPDLAANVENQPLFYDNQQVSGGGTSTAYDNNEAVQTISVSANTAGRRVRQTKMRFNYQPGKSQLVFMTFNFRGANDGITKREGIYDDNNGLFVELNGTTPRFVRRTYASGAAVDNPVAQGSWNLDNMNGSGPSGITLDWTQTQILVIDYEWLGVGRVRMGWVVNGLIYYAHQFLNTNILSTVYMQTPNLPLRSEIINSGTGPEDHFDQICSSVISEGGSEDLGVVRYASTGGTHMATAVENTIYAVIGLRLKANYIGASINIIQTAIQIQTTGDEIEWLLIHNPTVNNAFAYSGESNSAIEVAKGATANTVTGGTYIAGGFMESGGPQSGAGSDAHGILSALRLGSLIDGTRESIVLCVRPIAGSTTVSIEGGITWRELV